MCAHTFRPRERLQRRRQFLDVLKNGIWKESKNFRIVFCANGLTFRRLGLTVGKRTGTAVTRNRIKRLIREYFRCNKQMFPDAADIVISAKSGAARLDYAAVNNELGALLQGITLQHAPGAPEQQTRRNL